METTLILNHEYKKLPSAKTFWEIFAKLNFVIVLLAPVNRKIESNIEFSGPRDQVTLILICIKLA